MASTFTTENTRIEKVSLSFGSPPLESEPWSALYRMGEMVREHQASAEQLATASPVAPRRPENSSGDEAAALRMGDEGCPNEPNGKTVTEIAGQSEWEKRR